MRRLGLRSLGLLTTLATLLLGADCDEGSPIAPPRDFGVVLHDPGPYQHSYRSQPGPRHSWDGSTLAYVEMTAPVTVTGQVQHQDGSSAGGVCIFLNGSSELGDLSGVVDSQGLFTQTILPSTYDLTLAPDCFTGVIPAEFLEQVELDGATIDPWILPDIAPVLGQVVDTSNDAVVGAVVSVYEAGRPGRPLGITVSSDLLGEFSFDVAPGRRYDIVVTAPADGSVPIPPIRIDNQVLPLLSGLVMKIEYPVLPTAQLLGSLQITGGSTATGRIRIDGWVPAAPHGPQFTGGTFRAEFETDVDGRFELTLPLGSYRATAFPRHAERSFGTASQQFEVALGTEVVEVDLTLPGSAIARIEVQQSNGNPMVGATLGLHMRDPPFYSYGEITDEDGAWFGQLVPGIYEVEATAPEQIDNGEQRFARGHGILDLLGPNPGLLTIALRRSDLVDGFLYTIGQEGVRGAHVLLTDPDTGEIWDDTVTNDGEFPGFFRATLPR